MKVKATALSFLIGVVVLFLSTESHFAGTKTDPAPLKIGVVNIRKVFRDCKRNAKYRSDTLAEQSRWQAAEEKLQNQIDVLKDALKALKPGSSDYLKQLQELIQKQAEFESTRQFNSQQRTLKDKLWTEDFYQEILKIIAELAKQKELDLVFERSEPDFPAAGPDELMLILSTHKLLYSAGCPDITEEVTARLDKEK